MRRALLVAALVLVALPASAAITWISDDPETAFKQSRISKKPLLMYFHTKWCSWCVELEEKVFTDDAVSDASSLFVPLQITADYLAGHKLAKQFGVSAYPTILVLTPDKQVIGRLAAYRPVPGFLQFLKESLTPGERLADVDARIDKGADAPALLLESAERHADAMELEVAKARFEQAAASDPDGHAGVADDARMGLARLRTIAADPAGALEQYRIVLTSFPDSERVAEAFVSAVGILRDEDKGEDIDKLFARFADRFPDDPAVLIDHARRLLETKQDIPLALKKAQKAVELSPKSGDYQGTLARALLASNRPNEALEAISGAIDRKPSDTSLRILRLEILEVVRKPTTPAK